MEHQILNKLTLLDTNISFFYIIISDTRLLFWSCSDCWIRFTFLDSLMIHWWLLMTGSIHANRFCYITWPLFTCPMWAKWMQWEGRKKCIVVSGPNSNLQIGLFKAYWGNLCEVLGTFQSSISLNIIGCYGDRIGNLQREKFFYSHSYASPSWNVPLPDRRIYSQTKLNVRKPTDLTTQPMKCEYLPVIDHFLVFKQTAIVLKKSMDFISHLLIFNLQCSFWKAELHVSIFTLPLSIVCYTLSLIFYL